MHPVVLEAQNLKMHFPIKKLFAAAQTVKALDGVSFQLRKKKTLAVVGESGCGKSTLAKVLMQIYSPTDGSIELNGENFRKMKPSDYYKKIQMIFQDPYSSINPRKRCWEIISEPLKVNFGITNDECLKEAQKIMSKVGLRPEMAFRYPHMFSGGQRQRIGIARALIMKPEIIICDEPVSALDVSVQAQVINLLIDLQDEFNLSYIFISHDLSVVRHLCDDIVVMYLGKIVEAGSREEIFSNPQHPYTKILLESAPSVKKSQKAKPVLTGELPSPLNPPPGCAFHKRCPLAQKKCADLVPNLENKNGRHVACHFV